jgi:hypothetical protein
VKASLVVKVNAEILENSVGVDIIASTSDFKKTVYLQVKTNKNK